MELTELDSRPTNKQDTNVHLSTVCKGKQAYEGMKGGCLMGVGCQCDPLKKMGSESGRCEGRSG